MYASEHQKVVSICVDFAESIVKMCLHQMLNLIENSNSFFVRGTSTTLT